MIENSLQPPDNYGYGDRRREMPSRAWLGGGTNRASSPADWSPSGIPQTGDSLTVKSGTINVFGNDLAGDTLTMTGQDTVNLFGATATITALPAPETGTETQSAAPLVHVIGNDTLHANIAAGTIDIFPHSVWTGSVNAEFIPTGTGTFTEGLVVEGGRGSVFINSSTSGIMQNIASIGVNVLGIGAFDLAFGSLEFGKSVGAGQTVVVGPNGTLHLDDPARFAGSVSLQGGFVDLVNMAAADSYNYSNGVLSIFAGDTVIDTLKLINATTAQIDVTKAGTILTAYQATTPGVGALPLHT
jgi:hypothetical protein